MDVDGVEEASSQDTLSGQPDSQGSFPSMDLDEEDEVEGGPVPDEAGDTVEGRRARSRRKGSGKRRGWRGRPLPELRPRAS